MSINKRFDVSTKYCMNESKANKYTVGSTTTTTQSIIIKHLENTYVVNEARYVRVYTIYIYIYLYEWMNLPLRVWWFRRKCNRPSHFPIVEGFFFVYFNIHHANANATLIHFYTPAAAETLTLWSGQTELTIYTNAIQMRQPAFIF